MNKGPLSLFYDNFARNGFTMPDSPPINQSYCELAKECLGLDMRAKEAMPRGFLHKKKRQVMILVGGKRLFKDLPYEKWKALALMTAKHAKCIIADGPAQETVKRMSTDQDISRNKNILLIRGKRGLSELAKIANQSAIFIAVDGGGQHYLERYTNSVAIYTCTAPKQWLPFSENPYRKTRLRGGHVLESTITSHGLLKAGFYRVENRLPYYGFFLNVAKKEMVELLDITLLEGTIARALGKRN